MNINNPTTFSTPDLTLGTSNSSGTGGALRADDTILVYDTSVPASVGAASATGSASTAARRDHVHAAGQGVLLGTATASNSATLTVTGLSTTYNIYMVVGSRLRPATDGQPLQLRLGDSGGIDSGASDYTFHTGASVSNSNSYGGSSGTQSRIQLGSAGVDNGAASSIDFTGWLHCDGTVNPMFNGTQAFTYADDTALIYAGQFGGSRLSGIAVTQVQVSFASGNITSGTLTVWGIKTS